VRGIVLPVVVKDQPGCRCCCSVATMADSQSKVGASAVPEISDCWLSFQLS
jgi:hypothetical protein